MKTKTFIAPFIVGLLIAIAIAIGCKDKAEVVEPTQFEERINLDEYVEGITFIDCNFVMSEPNEIILWEGWEPNYPITFTFSSENIGSVNFEIGDNNEIICNGTREKWLRITYEAISGKEPTEKVTLRFAEPNEPNCGHGRLKSTHEYWAFTTTMDDKSVLFHGEYRCLDCGSNITIANAISTKGKE